MRTIVSTSGSSRLVWSGRDEDRPLIIEPEKSAGWAELYGSSKVFAAAGFREIGRPTERRVVMRIDLNQPEFE